MRRRFGFKKRRRAGLAAGLPAVLLASSLLTSPMGFAADPHSHKGDTGTASSEKVIYRDGGSVLRDRMMEEVKRQQEYIGQKGGYSQGANSHMLQQGVLLVADDAVKVGDGQRCPANAPVKEYHVSAINVEITLSRFLDYFPGYMYVLTENVEKARAEETANRTARDKEDDPGAVSNGLQGDVIQPLVIRANQGDCLKLMLHNGITEEATNLIINGSSMVVASTGKPATPSNPEATVPAGGQQSFEWYIKPDTQEGARFFRSHASRDQFNQGLIGMLVVEPRGSRYLSPFDGKPMTSGWEAMIEDPTGPDFREFAIFYHEAGDEAFRLLNKKGEMLPQRDAHTDSYRPGARLLNYRSEPHGTRIELQAHMGFYGDESMAYGSYTFGDPATTIPRSYLGDPAKFRMAGGSEIVHSHHLHGGSIRWARQPQMAGDYMYYSGRASHFAEGSWGLFRVLDKADGTLQSLPGREEIPQQAKSVCPADAPVKTFNVAAIDKAIRYNKGTPGAMEVDLERKMVLGNESGKMYVLEGEMTKVASGSLEPSPLTLHVNVGDCIKVNLKNEMAKERAGFHVDNLAYDPKESMGINAGNNPGDQTVAPGQSRMYTFFAHPEFGENAALIQDWGNVVENPRNGLFGAIIIGPKGSQYRDPVTGEDLAQKSSWRADVFVDRSVAGNETRQNYRSFALLFQDEDNIIGTSFMPYIQRVAGVTAVNYRSEPTDYRTEKGCAYSEVFACVKTGDQPVTPTIAAHVGDPVVIHVLGAFSEQVQLFSVSGHEWKHEPYLSGADLVSTMEFGGAEVINAWLHGGAGGPNSIPGDYLWLNQRPGYLDAGHWGMLKVLDRDSRAILPLSGQVPATQQAEEQAPVQTVPVSMKTN